MEELLKSMQDIKEEGKFDSLENFTLIFPDALKRWNNFFLVMSD